MFKYPCGDPSEHFADIIDQLNPPVTHAVGKVEIVCFLELMNILEGAVLLGLA